MRLLRKHGRCADWVSPPREWKFPLGYPHAVQPVDPCTDVAMDDEEKNQPSQVHVVPDNLPRSNRNPGKRLLDKVPDHVWLNAPTTLFPLQEMNGVQNKRRKLSENSLAVTAFTHSHQDTLTDHIYPEDMRSQIHDMARVRLQRPLLTKHAQNRLQYAGSH